MFLASTVPAYAIGFFITIILGGMGYKTTDALLLTAPPGLVGVSQLVNLFNVIPHTSRNS